MDSPCFFETRVETMKKHAVTLFIMALAGGCFASESLWQIGGFEQPESVILDSARQRLVVSNINGHPAEKDGNGYLSLLALDGTIQDRYWIDGLDAPKGMAILDGKLLVADIDRVHVINLQNDRLESTREVPSSSFLNDISSNASAAFISDLSQQSIFRYKEGEITLWLQSSELEHPNGLLVDDGVLLVASWGAGLHDDFSTDVLGGVLSIDLSSKAISPLPGTTRLGNLDGLVKTADGYRVNDWMTGELFALDRQGRRIGSEQSRKGLADIGEGESVLYLPFMLDGTVEARKIE